MNFLQKISFYFFWPRSGPCASLARSGQSLYPGEAICPSPTTSTSWRTETEGFGCEKWSEKWSEKVKWKVKSIFGPLNFFVFRYVEGGVLGNNYISIKKCRTTFLWEWSSTQVGGRKKNFQNLTTGMIFSKMVSNLSVLEGIFETKFQGWFFFRKNFKGISLIKFTTFLKIKKIIKGFLY